MTNEGNATSPYLQFDYLNRYVTRTKDYSGDTNLHNEWWANKDFTLAGGYLQNPLKHIPDVQFDVGFVFDNGINSSNQTYTAQTIAGGGDYYSDLDAGWVLWCMNENNHRAQISLETAGGVVTEKSIQEVHPNAFAGLGWQSALFESNSLVSAKVGCGWIDKPAIIAGDVVRMNPGSNVPEFDLKPTCEMSTYILYPVGGMYLNLEVETYFGNGSPDAWSIRAGATIPFSTFGSFLGNLVSTGK